MPRYVPSLDSTDLSLSQEAEAIIDEAEAPLRKWLDDSVDRLNKEFSNKIEESTKTLTKEISEMVADHQRLGNDVSNLINQLNRIELNLPAGIDPTLMADSKRIADEMRKYLAEREEKWKGAGANVVKALSTAKTAMTGIP